jgi:hypothetical protein
VIAIAPSENSSAQVKPETAAGNKYKNNYLGFELEVPKGWTLSIESPSLEEGNAAHASDPSKNGQKTKSVDRPWRMGKQVTLFEIKEAGPPKPGKPGLNAGADELVDGKDVTPLEYMRFIATDDYKNNAELPIVIDGEPFEVTIGGVKYSALSVHMDFADIGAFRARFLATIRNGYAVRLILAYRTDAELRESEEIVASIEYSAGERAQSGGHH